MYAITAAPTRLAIEGPKTDLSLSPVVASLDQAWAMLREAIPSLGAAVIVVQRSDRAWGHYTLNRPWGRPWLGGEQVPEIMISGENLARGAVAVFGTLAHEATHYLQHMDGLKGVDSNGRHNKTFQAGAEYYFGLTITKEVEHHGFSHTVVGEQCQERWTDVIQVIENGLAAAAGRPAQQISRGVGGFTGLGVFGVGGSRGGRNKNNPKAICGCGMVIRASRRVLETAAPVCQVCGETFTVME